MAFHGKIALITGAGSGMGRLAAQRLADAGATVAAWDVDEEGLRATASGRPGIHTRTVDVSNAPSVSNAVKEVETDIGPIDRVFNAAAIFPTALLLDQNLDQIHRIMEINYGGVVNVTLAVLPGMLERGRGDFVNFASLAGWLPTQHLGAYCASKFAVVAFSEVLLHENQGKGVRFACVCPPPVDTPLLEQATSNPKFLADARRIQPGEVLDAIETALEGGKFWVFPGRGSKFVWRMRRFLPGLIWRNLDRTERP